MINTSAVITFDSNYALEGASLAAYLIVPHINASAQKLLRDKDIISYLLTELPQDDSGIKFFLIYQKKGLSLAQISTDNSYLICANFHGDTIKYRRQKGGGKKEMIAKAVGLSGESSLNILDATCGLGADAFIMASLGGNITMTERVAEVYALVKDALKQAQEWGRDTDPELIAIINRMNLINADAKEYMLTVSPKCRPDVIYLDPMFPPRKKSAKVKKDMSVFHNLVGTDNDSYEMLPLALSCALKRVVVKRPRVASTLSSKTANYSFKGKSNRYDVYICN